MSAMKDEAEALAKLQDSARQQEYLGLDTTLKALEQLNQLRADNPGEKPKQPSDQGTN